MLRNETGRGNVKTVRRFKRKMSDVDRKECDERSELRAERDNE